MGEAALVASEKKNKAFADEIREMSRRTAASRGDTSTPAERDRRLPPRCLFRLGGGNLDADWSLFSCDGGDRTPEELLNPEIWTLASDYAQNRPLKPRDEICVKTTPAADGSWWRLNLEVIGVSARKPLFKTWGCEKVEAAGDPTVTHYGPGISIHEVGHTYQLMHNGVVAKFAKFEDARKEAESLQRKTA